MKKVEESFVNRMQDMEDKGHQKARELEEQIAAAKVSVGQGAIGSTGQQGKPWFKAVLETGRQHGAKPQEVGIGRNRVQGLA